METLTDDRRRKDRDHCRAKWCGQDYVRSRVLAQRGRLFGLRQRRPDRRGACSISPEAAAFRAGRLMLEEIKNHVRRQESVAFETTLSGLMYARLIPSWQALGYRVKLIY